MNISERDPFTFAGMSLAEDDLRPIRLALYHSGGDGYFIVRGFLDSGAVAHMRRFWSGVDPAATHTLFPGKAHIYSGCPDYYVVDADGNRTFHNFFWNAPLDELTHTLATYVAILRNRVSGRAPLSELLPFAGKAINYRVIISKNAKTWIGPHRDYADFERRFEKNRFDPSRLQATLFLAEKGVDYEGTGFKFERNDGRLVAFGTDVEVAAGDLVIWRYNNLHSVEDIRTGTGQFGFMRMIFPPEDVVLQPAAKAGELPPLRRRVGNALRALLGA
jgi:hypothetical protein